MQSFCSILVHLFSLFYFFGICTFIIYFDREKYSCCTPKLKKEKRNVFECASQLNLLLFIYFWLKLWFVVLNFIYLLNNNIYFIAFFSNYNCHYILYWFPSSGPLIFFTIFNDLCNLIINFFKKIIIFIGFRMLLATFLFFFLCSWFLLILLLWIIMNSLLIYFWRKTYRLLIY